MIIKSLISFLKILIKFQSNKPIMEKRRRARINQYLDELKSFILVNEKDVSHIFDNLRSKL